MLVRPKSIKVPKGNPFKNDKLGREKHIKRLTDDFLGYVKTPLVMTLASPWGSGKSCFVSMWKGYLEDSGHVCFLFDAWQHDFSKEPMLDIVGEIGVYAAGLKDPTMRERCQAAIRKIATNAAPLLRFSGELAELASPALPVLSCFLRGLKIGKSAAELIANYVGKGHSELKASLKACKKTLTELVSFISFEGRKPVYFFIDELDRCEPIYAIKLLEALKHFFDVEGIIFVLSLDKQQLSSMAKTRYGEAFDANGYLKRFIDMEHIVPEPSTRQFIEHMVESVYRLDDVFGDEFYTQAIVSSCSELCEQCKIPVRTIEKAFLRAYVPMVRESSRRRLDGVSKASIELGSDEYKTANKWYEYIILCAIAKEHDPDRFTKLLHAQIDVSENAGENDFHRLLRSTAIHNMFQSMRRRTLSSDFNHDHRTRAAQFLVNLRSGEQINIAQELAEILALTSDVSFPSEAAPST